MADINKEFDIFQYRDVIPYLMQAILSALPNEKNNPDQAGLYQAFEAGNVDELTKTERGQRKQIFVTSMSIHFVEDLSAASFDDQAIGVRITARTVSAGSRASAANTRRRGLEELMNKRTGGAQQQAKEEAETTTEESQVQPETAASNAGFIVTIVGYSPYKNIGRLFDPLGVGQDTSQWGFITRLKNLNKISDINSFVLFDANSIRNFTYKIDNEVTFDDTPAGVGIVSQRVIDVKKDTAAEGRQNVGGLSLMQGNKITEDILIDPMTREIINKVIKYNEDGSKKIENGKVVYEVNDHWFEIKAKFLWNNVPKQIAALAPKM